MSRFSKLASILAKQPGEGKPASNACDSSPHITTDQTASTDAQLERLPDGNQSNTALRVELGLSRVADGDLSAAEWEFRGVLADDPGNHAAWLNLGAVLDKMGRFDDATAALREALRFAQTESERAEAQVNLAVNLRDLGHLDESANVAEMCLAVSGRLDAHYVYALTLLTMGRLRDGWRQHEFRWMRPPLLARRIAHAVPPWVGQALSGKTLLVHAEQGLGDNIQFARFFEPLKDAGARVLFHVPPPLAKLSEGFDGCDAVVVEGAIRENIHYYCHALSLPHVLGIGADPIPGSVPYLRIDEQAVQRWAARLPPTANRRIGIVWAGNPSHGRDRERSIPLAVLKPLLDVPGFDFVSLQQGSAESEIASNGLGDQIHSLGPLLGDLTDTAAVIQSLDLVLCVDTAVAHLAGALGKPVWLMLPQPADWRWMMDRSDSPWYPTMRLFRQAKRGDWPGVVSALADELSRDALMAARPANTPRASSTPEVTSGAYDHFGAVAEVRGAIIHYLPDDGPIGQSIRTYGEYLQQQLDVLLPMIDSGSVIVEVGAGIGVHTLALCSAAGPQGQVIAYESDVRRSSILAVNLAANAVANATIIRKSADGPANVDVEGAQGAIAGADSATRAHSSVDALQLDRLDWLVANLDAPARLTLRGAEDSLWRLRPRIVLQVSTASELTEIQEALQLASYRWWTGVLPLFNANNFYQVPAYGLDSVDVQVLIAVPEESATPERMPDGWTRSPS